MGKWYEVTIMVHKVIVVEVEDDWDEHEAHDFALGECDFNSSDIVESNIVPLITTEQIDCARRHADQVEDM